MLDNVKNFLINIFGVRFLFNLRDRIRINTALTKGSIGILKRKIDLKNPSSWEFSGFSQNGEDGIIDVLCDQINVKKNKYFIEIGSADGIDNNSAWPLITKKFNGLMIEADSNLIKRAHNAIKTNSNTNNHGLQIIKKFVSINNIHEIKERSQFLNPDFLSLDIDSMDYYVAKKIFEIGLRPKIFIVEYNSVFGPKNTLTVEYDDNFIFGQNDPDFLYYGAGIGAWKYLFTKNNYEFITVDSNGVNAFFVDQNCFDSSFLENINKINFAENQLQYEKFRCEYDDQFKKIEHLSYFDVSSV